MDKDVEERFEDIEEDIYRLNISMDESKKKKTQIMGGWKTWAGALAVGAIAAAQGLEAAGIIPPGTANTVSIVLGSIGGALGLVGLGHKLEKGQKPQ